MKAALASLIDAAYQFFSGLEPSEGALRAAVVAFDRASNETDRERLPERAIAIWNGFVTGGWTPVEHFERDGRRYLLAVKRPAGARDPKALTRRESQVVAYLGLGSSTKETAYALGISEHTVGVHLGAAMKKLGFASRVELIRVMNAIGRAAARVDSAPVLSAKTARARLPSRSG